ncbi:MAG: iron-sulfur cluster assembly scaffold protein [Desulfobacterales bacterium]
MTANPDEGVHHSQTYLEMALRTDRHRTVENPDAYGEKTGRCGDTIAFFVIIDGNRIESISFSTDGCLNTNACANAVAELNEGKMLDEAWEITPETVIEYLQILPEDAMHCAELSVGAFYRALAGYTMPESP